MGLNTILFYHSNNLVEVNYQIFIIYNIIATCFWLVNQESDLGHCLNSKCQTTGIFTFIDISTCSYYVTLNASNVRYLAFIEHLNYQKKIILRNLTINNKISKNAIFATYVLIATLLGLMQ